MMHGHTYIKLMLSVLQQNCDLRL